MKLNVNNKYIILSFGLYNLGTALLSRLYPLSPSSQTFWVVVGSLFSSFYELFHLRLLPRFMSEKEKPVTFIGLLLYFFHFQINWFRRFDDKRNFFYPIFILCTSFVGMFVSMRSTHGVYLKTKLIGLLPIRGVDPLGWFFEQPLLNGVSTGDGSFLPTNFHEGKMKRMVGFLRRRRLTHIHVYHFRVSMYYHLNFLLCRPILYSHFLI